MFSQFIGIAGKCENYPHLFPGISYKWTLQIRWKANILTTNKKLTQYLHSHSNPYSLLYSYSHPRLRHDEGKYLCAWHDVGERRREELLLLGRHDGNGWGCQHMYGRIAHRRLGMLNGLCGGHPTWRILLRSETWKYATLPQNVKTSDSMQKNSENLLKSKYVDKKMPHHQNVHDFANTIPLELRTNWQCNNSVMANDNFFEETHFHSK